MRAEFINPFIVSLVNTFETMLSCEVTRGKPHLTDYKHGLYEINGVIHYCVANMPGAVARTSTFALNNATLPFALKLANFGAERAMADDPHLAAGLNVSDGKIRNLPVAEALGLPYFPIAA